MIRFMIAQLIVLVLVLSALPSNATEVELGDKPQYQPTEEDFHFEEIKPEPVPVLKIKKAEIELPEWEEKVTQAD